MVIILILIVLIIKYDILHQKINLKENKLVEHFMEANFALCDENDCDCLKLNMAPDGTCVDYKIVKSHDLKNIKIRK